MLETLKRLISPEYLAVADPGPLGGSWVLYLALGLFFAAGLAAVLWLSLGTGRNRHSAAYRAWAWFEGLVCLAGLATVAGRFLGWPGWSARIWPYTLAALAIAGALAYLFRHLRLRPQISVQLRILALLPAQPAPPCDEAVESALSRVRIVPYLLVLVLHLAGIALVLSARFGWPPWTAPLALLVLLAPQAPLLLRRRLPNLMALTPLFGAYAATILWLIYQGLGITIVGWQGLAFPNPMLSLFYLDAIILASVVYSILCQFQVAAGTLGWPALFWRGAVVALLVAALAWAGVVYFGKRTHGATATDPYAYAQMGKDLAEHGTFLHRFSLFQQVIPLNIAWAPLLPVGYHIPGNELGDRPSVWAPGAAVLLAAGFKALGEAGLYVTTPIVALLALAATWLLAQVTLRGAPRAVRFLTGALALALLATSPEHVDRLLVPMADAPAQFFTVLTLLFALLGMHQLADGRRGLGSFFLAGLFCGWAYWVRHTQVVLVLPGLLAVSLGYQAWRRTSSTHRTLAFILPLAIFLGAALVAALPDLLYHWRVFGGPFNTETTELPLMGLQNIGPVAWQMLRDALVAGEWGYLFPLAVYGGYRLARERGREALILGSAFLAVLLVNLTYRSLRLRDLIPLFPIVDLAVAYGAVALVRRVRAFTHGSMARLGPALLPVFTVAFVILSLALSRWAMIDNLWKPGWASFGYMRIEQRAAFDRLAELTPPESIIGASLNAGAVTMLTGRDAVRPYDSWTEGEWSTFLEAMHARGRPVYLLDDGGLMADFIAREAASYRLAPIEELAIPLFYTRDRETGWLYRLEWDDW